MSTTTTARTTTTSTTTTSATTTGAAAGGAVPVPRDGRHPVAARTRPGSRPPATGAGSDLVAAWSGGEPLLSAAEEVELAHRIEAGILAQEQLDLHHMHPARSGPGTAEAAAGPAPVDATADELRELVTLGEAARERMVAANVRLAAYWAHRKLRRAHALAYQPDLPFEDLLAAGVEGLIHAVQLFDYQRGFKFSTYASSWIRQRQTKAALAARAIRLPAHIEQRISDIGSARAALINAGVTDPTAEQVAAAAGITVAGMLELTGPGGLTSAPRSLDALLDPTEPGLTLADLLPDPHASDPADVVAGDAHGPGVKAALERLRHLPQREAVVLRLLYGLDGAAPLSERAAARRLGVPVHRVAAARDRALTRLRTVTPAPAV